MTFWRGFRTHSFGTILLTPLLALAATPLDTPIVPTNCSGPDAATLCGVCDLATLAQNLLNTAIFVLIALSAVMFAYAGWQSMTAGGNSAKYTAARKVFTNVAVGLVIILGSWIVIDTLMKTFVKPDSRFGPWNKICMEIEEVFEHHYA